MAAPFPDTRYKAGVRRFPKIVPDKPSAEGAELSRRAQRCWNTQWDGPAFMAAGMKDPVLGAPAMKYSREQIRICPPPMELAEGGHFVQECGEQIARRALEVLR